MEFRSKSAPVNRAVAIRGDLHVTYYGGLPNSRRPTGFMISVRVMTFNHRFVNYRMFMIPNVPSDACTNRNHPYWNLQ